MMLNWLAVETPQFPSKHNSTSQMSIQCLTDRTVYEILSKLILSAKYLALQTVFTFSSVLKPAETIKIFTPSCTVRTKNEDYSREVYIGKSN